MAEKHGEELQRFAEGLIRLVRDRAVRASDRLASGAMVGPDGERWRSLVASKETSQAIRELIPDIVDQTLFELLNATDNGELPLGWRVSEGSFVGLEDLGLGEMAGSLMGSPGWRHDYSAQRFFDPLSDLRLGLDPEPSDEK
ncbi:MAG: hypothetical protein JF614_11215 [Acidobacteria bacterium]|nr:hypothetical protein [Acidobacteriota bacterium]